MLTILDLQWDPGILQYQNRTAERLIVSPTYEDVTKPIYDSSVGRWRNYGDYLEPHVAKLHQILLDLGYT